MSALLHLPCSVLRRHCARRRLPCVQRCAAACRRGAVAPHRPQCRVAATPHRRQCRPTRLSPRAGAELLADPWSVNSESLAASLFAVSLAPYLVFLYNLNRAKGPPLMNFGFAFLLVFVFATIPAGIYGAFSTLHASPGLAANSACPTTRSQERVWHLAGERRLVARLRGVAAIAHQPVHLPRPPTSSERQRHTLKRAARPGQAVTG